MPRNRIISDIFYAKEGIIVTVHIVQWNINV